MYSVCQFIFDYFSSYVHVLFFMSIHRRATMAENRASLVDDIIACQSFNNMNKPRNSPHGRSTCVVCSYVPFVFNHECYNKIFNPYIVIYPPVDTVVKMYCMTKTMHRLY